MINFDKQRSLLNERIKLKEKELIKVIENGENIDNILNEYTKLVLNYDLVSYEETDELFNEIYREYLNKNPNTPIEDKLLTLTKTYDELVFRSKKPNIINDISIKTQIKNNFKKFLTEEEFNYFLAACNMFNVPVIRKEKYRSNFVVTKTIVDIIEYFNITGETYDKKFVATFKMVASLVNTDTTILNILEDTEYYEPINMRILNIMYSYIEDSKIASFIESKFGIDYHTVEMLVRIFAMNSEYIRKDADLNVLENIEECYDYMIDKFRNNVNLYINTARSHSAKSYRFSLLVRSYHSLITNLINIKNRKLYDSTSDIISKIEDNFYKVFNDNGMYVNITTAKADLLDVSNYCSPSVLNDMVKHAIILCDKSIEKFDKDENEKEIKKVKRLRKELVDLSI